MTEQNVILLAGVLILALVLVAPVTADTIEVNTGNGQLAQVNTPVAIPPSIKVMNGSTPVSGVSVTFAVTNGGGSITGTSTIQTGADGIATVGGWTLGTATGPNSLTATSAGLSGSPVSFTATGTAGPAVQMLANSVTSQSAPVGTAVATPPSVIVKDVYGNPKSGQQVTFSISVGGGSVSPSTAITTGSDGIATVSNWTIGTIGTNSLIANGVSTLITFTATGTSSTSTPTITSISPTSAVNSGQQTIDIAGTGFTGSAVTLTKTGQSTITGVTTGSDTAVSLSRNFNLNGVALGTWNLVILNSDGGSVTGSFIVRNATAATVTSISPTSGTANNTVTTTITGAGFVPGTAKIRIYKSGNYIGGAVNSGGSASQLTGSFNLNYASPGTYEVCVLYDGTEGSKTCGPAFVVYSDIAGAANGTLSVKSAPTGSKVYLSNVYKGYTPLVLENITPGTYTVAVLRTGYKEWSESVKVTGGNTSSVSASLVLMSDATAAATATAAPVKTTTTVKKSTLKVPTTWPSVAPTTTSPVDPLVIIGTVCFAFLALRKY